MCTLPARPACGRLITWWSIEFPQSRIVSNKKPEAFWSLRLPCSVRHRQPGWRTILTLEARIVHYIKERHDHAQNAHDGKDRLRRVDPSHHCSAGKSKIKPTHSSALSRRRSQAVGN